MYICWLLKSMILLSCFVMSVFLESHMFPCRSLLSSTNILDDSTADNWESSTIYRTCIAYR